MNKVSYEQFLDKVYGCFLGKTVVGTLGAPYEGVKMPMNLPYSPEMIHTMLPNDDLDLQILWLDVVEKYGEDFTSYQLLDRFVNFCDYSPGEYAIMRKNYLRGIYPPLSGQFCNDFYRAGMGCPIRSEIWACLAPADPKRAADLSERDGVLDHVGDSVYAERFFAALESAAFVESDLRKLIDIGLSEVPEICRFRELVNDTLALCDRYDDSKLILRKILFKWGHPDCTNMFQNIGITLTALLKGNLDIIKTGMDALNCGHDTDCTCATAGAVIGAIRGAKSLIEEYALDDVKFKLGVRSDRRSDSVADLSEDIAQLAVAMKPELFEGTPEVNREFVRDERPVTLEFHYEIGDSGEENPAIGFGETRRVFFCLHNRSEARRMITLRIPSVHGIEPDKTCVRIYLEAGQGVRYPVNFTLSAEAEEILETNLFDVVYTVDDGAEETARFGLVGKTPWKVTGPIFETDPVATDEKLAGHTGYWHLFADVDYKEDKNDVVRRFHLNYKVDLDTPFCNEEELFTPFNPEAKTAREETLWQEEQDSFTMDDICGFSGPCVLYLSRELTAKEETEVCFQIGHSSPFTMWVNGQQIARRDGCDTWDAENVHLQHIHLHAGVNRMVWRLVRVNKDAKFNLTIAVGPTCADHLIGFGSVNPEKFR